MTNHKTATNILLMLGGAHLLNDLIQSMLTATYPLLEYKFALSFAEIGMISLVYQMTASILQPGIGHFTDKKPMPYLIPFGMMSTVFGIIVLALTNQYLFILAAAAFMGIGSSIFHPEGSRLARFASGGRYGLAQAVFQVGGNFGSALGPLLTSFIIIRYSRQENILFFTLFGALAIFLLFKIAKWSSSLLDVIKKDKSSLTIPPLPYGKKTTYTALAVLGLLIFSKYFYMASMTNYYAFYLIDKFDVSRAHAVNLLFVFLASVAVGTLSGGPIGDRIGRRYVIWVSILGVAPFTLLLPHVDYFGTIILSIIIGLVLSSAFAAIVVYAQELVPGRTGMISGLFFGLMFGMSGIAAALLGIAADKTSLYSVYLFCSFLPLLGIFTVFLPRIELLDR